MLHDHAIRKLDGTLLRGHLCPFCGDGAKVIKREGADFDVTCHGELDEECRGVIVEENFNTGYLTEQFAIDAWNKRASNE